MADTQTPDAREIQKIKIDPERSPSRKLKFLTGTVYMYGPESTIPATSSFGVMERFASGETISWPFDVDEWHYTLKGEADVTYSLRSTFHTERKTMHVAPGDLYLVPAGAYLTWKVTSKDDLVRLCIVMHLSAPKNPRISYVAPGALEEL